MKTGLLRTIEDLMVAVTFAEKDDHEYAIWVMNSEEKEKKQHHARKNLKNPPENRPQMRL